MLACHVPQQVGLLLEAPVTVRTLEAGLNATLVLDVMFEPLTCLVQT